jgi:hypothetical protein
MQEGFKEKDILNESIIEKVKDGDDFVYYLKSRIFGKYNLQVKDEDMFCRMKMFNNDEYLKISQWPVEFDSVVRLTINGLHFTTKKQ